MSTYQKIIYALQDMYVRKNHDYKNSAHRTFCRFGPVALIVRINDKIERINALMENDAMVSSESITDSHMDAANYLIMLAAELTWASNLGRNVLLIDREDTSSNHFAMTIFQQLLSSQDEPTFDQPIVCHRMLDTIYDDIEYFRTDDAIAKCIHLASYFIHKLSTQASITFS